MLVPRWDVQTRWSFYPAGSLSIMSISFAAAALLEAERDAGRADVDNRARGAARWMLDSLGIEPDGFFAYHPYSEARVWAQRPYPEDGHSAGTALSALAPLLRTAMSSPTCSSVWHGGCSEAASATGHVIFRRYRFGLRSFVKSVRWCDAHAALGLADAALVMSQREDRAPTSTLSLH